MDRIIPTSKAVEITHEHQDLGVNIIIEGVKAVEAREAKEQEVFEAEFQEVDKND